MTVAAVAILADPPWRYRNWSDAAHGAAASAYDTMAHEDLAALPVASWAAPDCALFLWGTWPMLPQAVALMDAWGFVFVSGLPWVKTVPSTGDVARGVGFWTMAASEYLLIGRRGKPRRERGQAVLGLAVDGDVGAGDRVLWAPRGAHSRKPELVHEWIERLFTAGPRLELFARRPRPGWTTWGRDTGHVLTPEGVVSCDPASGALDVPMPLFGGEA